MRGYSDTPLTEVGTRFKDRFLNLEIATSLRLPQNQSVLSSKSLFVFSVIKRFNPKPMGNTRLRDTDFAATFDGDETDLENSDAMTFFSHNCSPPLLMIAEKKD
jgi:hypothetical protein